MDVRWRWASGLCLAVGCGDAEQTTTNAGSSTSSGRDDGTHSDGNPSSDASVNPDSTSEPAESSSSETTTTATSSTATDATATASSDVGATSSSSETSGSETTSSETSSSETGNETTSNETTSNETTSSSSGLVTGTTESTWTGGDLCGDGMLDEGEICDDGNLVGGDGCEPDCTSSDDVEPIWTLELGGPTGYVDCGTGVAFDGVGNLILGAYTEPDVIWIRKYDVDYVEQWTVTYPGQPGGSCPRTRVATDADGNIGFIGADSSAAGILFGVLDPDGGELWTLGANDLGSVFEFPGDVAFDGEGSLLLTGAVVPQDGTFADLWVAKYASLGQSIWSDSYDGVGGRSDLGYGIDADMDGNVLVAGVVRGVADDNDIFVRKYDPDGGEPWTDIVAGPEAGTAYDYGYGYGIATNFTESVVAGVFKPAGESHQIWSRQYSPDGAPVWTSLHEQAGLGDAAASIDWSPGFGVLVAGTVREVGFVNVAWLRKLDEGGAPVWTRLRQLPGSFDLWQAVAIASDGRIAVAGSAQLASPFDYEGHFAVYPP